jgi:hypothetical protein
LKISGIVYLFNKNKIIFENKNSIWFKTWIFKILLKKSKNGGDLLDGADVNVLVIWLQIQLRMSDFPTQKSSGKIF